jgi:hypothetical protein
VKQHRIIVSGLLDNFVCWCLAFVDQIGVKDVELVSLDDLGRRIVRAADKLAGSRRKNNNYVLIMRLVVFVPLVSRVNAVKVPRLARPVLVFPSICSRVHN